MRWCRVIGFVVVVMLSAATARADSRTFDLRHRSASEIADRVRALLSADGGLVVDDAANALVVRDTAAVLRDIEKLVAKLDVPPTLWNVTISPADGFTELESPKGAEVIDLGPWRVTTMPTGRRESARVTSSAEAAATTLHIRSGESAIFSVGSSVRVDELQGAWFGRHGFGVDLRSASARAEMALRVSGSRENVRLDITPRVVVEIPSGPVMRQLDGIDVPFRKDRSILISIRSGDATDIWGPAGVGVVNAWMLTVTSEYAP